MLRSAAAAVNCGQVYVRCGGTRNRVSAASSVEGLLSIQWHRRQGLSVASALSIEALCTGMPYRMSFAEDLLSAQLLCSLACRTTELVAER